MLSLNQIREALTDRRLAVVAEATGLHVNTLLKLRMPNSNPTHRVMKLVSDYLEQPVK